MSELYYLLNHCLSNYCPSNYRLAPIPIELGSALLNVYLVRTPTTPPRLQKEGLEGRENG